MGGTHPRPPAPPPPLDPPDLPFCARTVLRHDYSTWLLVVTLFTALHVASVGSGRDRWEPAWGIAFLLSVGIAIAVKVVKYRTRWLHVPGR